MKYWILLLGLVVLSACEPSHERYSRPLALTPDELQLASANNAFTLALFKRLAGDETEKNVVLSPLSIGMDVSMAAEGAEGATRADINNVLQLSSFTPAAIHNYFQKVITTLPYLDANVKLNIANSVWINKNFPVSDEFKHTVLAYYGANANSLAFNDGAVTLMNKWVSDATSGQIPHIIDGIEDGEQLFLLNALYFKAPWKYQFPSSQTLPGDFYKVDNTVVKADFMNGSIPLFSGGNGSVNTFELTYADSRFSMLFLQSTHDDLQADVISKLDTAAWHAWTTNLQAGTRQVSIPKFKTGFTTHLNGPLTAMGMGRAFSDRADFSGITPGGELRLSEVRHRTVVQVDESGTEAAAATVTSVVVTGAISPLLLNRPFVYVIRERASQLILFIGVMNNPQLADGEK